MIKPEYTIDLLNKGVPIEIPKGFHLFNIWSEGYAATGESGTATKFANEKRLDGKWAGRNFKEACQVAMKIIDPTNRFYNVKTNSYWACSLFDNRSDASKSFG